ncbi:hypothetical protein KJ765_03420 [Candidatus Micrarchaeota archaeon]|nr:hypothetical protein [Candidatus Micrarchaeota archaeon]
MARARVQYHGPLEEGARPPTRLKLHTEEMEVPQSRTGVFGRLGRLFGFGRRRRSVIQHDLHSIASTNEEWQALHNQMFRGLGRTFGTEHHVNEASRMAAGDYEYFASRAAEFQRALHGLRGTQLTEVQRIVDKYSEIAGNLRRNPDLFKAAVQADLGPVRSRAHQNQSYLVNAFVGKTNFFTVRRNVRSIINNHGVEMGQSFLEVYKRNRVLKRMLEQLNTAQHEIGNLAASQEARQQGRGTARIQRGVNEELMRLLQQHMPPVHHE